MREQPTHLWQFFVSAFDSLANYEAERVCVVKPVSGLGTVTSLSAVATKDWAEEWWSGAFEQFVGDTGRILRQRLRIWGADQS